MPGLRGGVALTRVLLFTGKGGAGKTSVAAATAVRAAAGGSRVLLSSTDAAHSLADALATRLGDTPRPVAVPGRAAGRLLVQQVDTQSRLEARWDRVRDYLASVLAWGGVGELAAEELVSFPGLDELFALLDLDDQIDAGHDVIVVDCAPTAETLKLLSLPDALRWYVDRGLGARRRAARAVAPLTRSLGASGAPFPVPDDHVVDDVGHVHRQLASVHALLTDVGRSSVRLVSTPERLALAETCRTLTTLSLFGYGIDAVVVNRLLPEAITDPYLRRWQQRHAAGLDDTRLAVAPMPVLTAPLLPDEPIGPTALAELGDELYADATSTDVLHHGAPITVDTDDDLPRLRLRLPGVTRDEVELHHHGRDLLIKVAGVRRSVPLPAVLRRREVVGAAVADGILTVRFAGVPATATGS